MGSLALDLDYQEPLKQRDDCVGCQGRRGGVKGNENLVGGLLLCDHCSVDLDKLIELAPERELLGTAISRAADSLPGGWSLSIHAEAGCGWVDLIDAGHNEVPSQEFCSVEDNLGTQCLKALRFAIAKT